MRSKLMPLWVVLLGGCPEIGRMTYRFDLATGEGSLALEDIGTDDPASALSDFALLVNDYLLGARLQDEHPGWRVAERRLIDAGGRLDGVVRFGFEGPQDVGLYQRTRKSDWLWCARDGERVIATSGSVVPPYPNCVLFDRKTRQFEVTVTTDDGQGARTSLLPLYQAWDGGAIPADAAPGGAIRGGGPPPAPAPNLSTFLPEVTVPAVWSGLGLPIAGGKPVFVSERTYEASHPGATPAEVVARYEALLAGAGFSAESPGSDPSVWVRGGERVSVTATSAGSTVVVDLAR